MHHTLPRPQTHPEKRTTNYTNLDHFLMYSRLVKILFRLCSCIRLVINIKVSAQKPPKEEEYLFCYKSRTKCVKGFLITCRSSLLVTNCTTRNHMSSLIKSPALSINWRITSTYLQGLGKLVILTRNNNQSFDEVNVHKRKENTEIHNFHSEAYLLTSCFHPPCLPWKIRSKLLSKNGSLKWQFLTHCKISWAQILVNRWKSVTFPSCALAFE